MDYIEGQNLEDVLKQQGTPLAESLVLTWADQVLSALNYLHAHQPHAIIHRDIKPANIILMASGHVKLVDFGLVKLFDPDKPATVNIVRGMGTPEYTPLEQYGTSTSHTDNRSDIYGLGATLYHLLTNVAPPDAQLQFVNPAALVALGQYNPDISARTEAAILKAMAMRPDERFQSTQEFRAALFGTQPVVPPINRPISAPDPTIRVTSATTAQKQEKGRIALVGWLAGVALLLLLVIAALLPRVLNNLSAADSPPSAVAEQSATEQPANSPLATSTRASEAEPTRSPTPSCLFQSDFVKDVTIPDGTLIEAGERFIKTWRMRNSGTCDWPEDRHRIVFAGGDQLGPASIGMPATNVGEELDISLEMQAPPEPGSYQGTWELWDEKGKPYGLMIVQINVPGEATSSPPPSNQSESKLAFASERDGNSEIYIQQSNGLVERLTNHPSGDWKPTWSPDGTLIAFESDRTDNYDIYVMDSNGSGVVNLTEHPDNDSWPAWSSTGRIAFQSNREKNWDIYLINHNGSNFINMTNTPTHELQPAWSPDGRQIAFISTDNERWDIYVMDADGTNRRQLTTHEADDMHPAWSPDGSQIAFTSYRDGNFELYLMNADGSSKKRLTLNPEANDIQPVWHPVGGQLSFTSNLNGSDNELYLINPDGSGLTNFTKSFGDDRWPAWWP